MKAADLCSYRRDRVISFLVDRLGLGPLGVAVVTLLFFSGGTALLNWYSGTLDDLWSAKWATHWTAIPVLVPVLFALVVYVHRQVPQLFQDLEDSGAVKPGAKAGQFFDDLQASFDRRVVNWVLVGGLAAAAVIVWYVKVKQNWSDWTHPTAGRLSAAGIYWNVMMLLGAYVLARLAWAVAVVIGALRRIFEDEDVFEVRLLLLHPDGCCGLRPISAFVLAVSLALMVVGLLDAAYLVVSLVRLDTVAAVMAQVGGPLLLVLYVVLAPLLFFLPMVPAHRRMKAVKRSFLMSLLQVFDPKFRAASAKMAAGAIEKPDTDELNEIRELYVHADSIPVWPFDAATLKRFAGTVLTPLALTLGSMILKKLIGAS